jgi:DNA-binding NtrC family response regulator
MSTRAITKRRPKILVVGNEPAIVVSLRTMLTLSKHHVIVTDEPASAVKLTKTIHSDIRLALIDVCATDVEPRLLAERLRSVQPEIKILFFSSLVDGEVIRLGIVDPARAVLREDGVVAAIQEALQPSVDSVRTAPNGGLKTMTAGGSSYSG